MHRTIWLLTWLLISAPAWAEESSDTARPAQSKPEAEPKSCEHKGKKATPAADPNIAMLDHVQAVFEMLAKHKNECDKAVGMVEAYVIKHKKELKELRRRAEKLEKSLCPKARKSYDKKTLKRVSKMGDKYMPVMFHIYSKCPKHMERLQAAMVHLGTKCKEQ